MCSLVDGESTANRNGHAADVAPRLAQPQTSVAWQPCLKGGLPCGFGVGRPRYSTRCQRVRAPVQHRLVPNLPDVFCSEGRNRFALQVARATTEAVGADKVGIRVSPDRVFNGTGAFPDVEQQYLALVRELSALKLMYAQVLDHSAMGTPPVAAKLKLKLKLRDSFSGPFILAGGFGQASAEKALAENGADLIAFGRPFLANPDLVERFQSGAALNAPDMATFYTLDAKGYTDYPTLAARAEVVGTARGRLRLAVLLLIFGMPGASLDTLMQLFVPTTALVPCFITGLHNAIATKMSRAEIRTPYMTGAITDLGIKLGRLVYWNQSPRHGEPVKVDRDPLVTLATILGLFLAGASSEPGRSKPSVTRWCCRSPSRWLLSPPCH